MRLSEYTAYRTDNVITFERDAGECYGGLRTTYLDIAGVNADDIYHFIVERLSKEHANAYLKK